MKIKTFLALLATAVVFGSCKKYTCECTTTTYDYNTGYSSTSTTTHNVKAMTRVKAISDCNTYSDYDTDCSLQ